MCTRWTERPNVTDVFPCPDSVEYSVVLFWLWVLTSPQTLALATCHGPRAATVATGARTRMHARTPPLRARSAHTCFYLGPVLSGLERSGLDVLFQPGGHAQKPASTRLLPVVSLVNEHCGPWRFTNEGLTSALVGRRAKLPVFP